VAKARPLTGLDPQAPTEENARIIVRERLADMYAYAPYVENPENIQELHDLRIAAKRVRYTLEVFADFLPATSKDFAQELADLQDELGELHDSEVMLALLRRLLQQTQAAPGSSYENEFFAQTQELLSSDMVEYILLSARNSALSAQELQGLTGFLHRQEQHRVQAYASFHRHWKSLEQRHFRESLLQMLEQRGG
jgi:CHAD domain-containing protein